ncbi:hypothetical protein [Mesorhizobium sp. L2C067A000]|uniref:hypothetical protein n=1 Tax=Mesorhizobium sp. L2C067A000 TaxID=1287106 RepID=UPI0003CFA50D|nr:hypothetical protein [Mesorhizobium sp. L2C067A000]ESZ37539.1 hypothetical protein X733_02850 [Mesorhizobium sp. L2C067A000]
MGLDLAVFKSVSTMEREFPGYRFQRDPENGECEVIHPEDVTLTWDDVTTRDWRVGNIAHIAALGELIAGLLGEGSALERMVLLSASGVGDVIEEPSFGELKRELRLIESSTDPWVREFADGLVELISMARREKNPIVFV